MKKGMKKFTKICLITAAALGGLGALICCICMVMGGFRQLSETDVKALTGIPFYYRRGGAFGFYSGKGVFTTAPDDWDEWAVWNWDDDWDDDADDPDDVWDDDADDPDDIWDDDADDPDDVWDDDADDWDDDDDDWDDDDVRSADRSRSDDKRSGSISPAPGMSRIADAASVTRLTLDADACELDIAASPDNAVYLAVESGGASDQVRYKAEGNTLQIAARFMDGKSLYDAAGYDAEAAAQNKVTLYLPEEMALDNLAVSMDMGIFNDEVALSVRAANMSFGAGDYSVGRIAGGELELALGAGALVMDGLTVNQMEITVGAGQLTLADARIAGEAELSVGMGEIHMDSGSVGGDMEIDCGMGEIELHLQEQEETHNYEIECDMGEVRIGGTSYSGLSVEKEIRNGSGSTCEISCGVGSVRLVFAEQP